MKHIALRIVLSLLGCVAFVTRWTLDRVWALRCALNTERPFSFVGAQDTCQLCCGPSLGGNHGECERREAFEADRG